VHLPDAADNSHFTASQDSLGALVCPGALRPDIRRFPPPAPFGYAGRTPSMGGNGGSLKKVFGTGINYFSPFQNSQSAQRVSWKIGANLSPFRPPAAALYYRQQSSYVGQSHVVPPPPCIIHGACARMPR
jgi:hypothetical protein